MKTYGLIGKNIDYSFSRNYFNTKFKNENIENSNYVNFDIQDLSEIKTIFEKEHFGYNVTIPYKESIIPFLDKLDKDTKEIGAVNTIKVHKDGSLEGFNTDYYGFMKSIKPYLKKHHKKALILGTGGASKAVAFALKKMNIEFKFVSRNPKANQLSYESLTEMHFNEAHIIINTTPIGTFPDIDKAPKIPYSLITNKHLVFDLIYNPSETQFLINAKANNAVTLNGLDMLINQAEKAWEIWNQ